MSYPLYHILFFTCYGGMALSALLGCFYLLFRRNNAFSSDITSPLLLRRWTAVTYATVFMSHTWWMLFFYMQDGDNLDNRLLLCRCLDFSINWSATFYTMLVMLQDRRRPFSHVLVFIVLALTGLFVYHFFHTQLPWLGLLLIVSSFVYVVITMLVSVRQYGRWLRENYADLEHKEVWQTYLVMFAFLPTILFYSFNLVHIVFDILLEIVDIMLLLVLLWRVETLQSLEEPTAEPDDTSDTSDDATALIYSKIELLLQQKCVDTHFYLHHDMSLSHLAKNIGTNTTYLSRYFSHHGLTYNTYINTLRVEHFMRLYQESAKSSQFVTAAELAYNSGYKSYSTFSAAFKQINGETVSQWMRKQENSGMR